MWAKVLLHPSKQVLHEDMMPDCVGVGPVEVADVRVLVAEGRVVGVPGTPTHT